MSAGNTLVFPATPQPSNFLTPAANGVARVQLTGAFSGAAIFEETLDNANWFASPWVFADNALTAGVPTLTAPGTFTVKMPGTVALRLRCTGSGSGTMSVLCVFLQGSDIGLSPFASTGGGGGTSTTAPYKATLVATGTATLCLSPSGAAATYLVGVVNNALVAQTATLLVYDNVSAAAGTVAASIAALGASQVITFPPPGLPLVYGATAIASSAPTAPGVQVLTR
jgi:hypothetical protein